MNISWQLYKSWLNYFILGFVTGLSYQTFSLKVQDEQVSKKLLKQINTVTGADVIG